MFFLQIKFKAAISPSKPEYQLAARKNALLKIQKLAVFSKNGKITIISFNYE